MSKDLRSTKKTTIFLVGNVSHQIVGSKLPSNRQVLAVLFYSIREVKLTVSESANLAVRECNIFWEKARIPTRSLPNNVKKLVKLYEVWRDLQKNSSKTQELHERRRHKFARELDSLFDIAHANAYEIMKIEEDKLFLQRQREPGRPGCLLGVDLKLAQKEKRARERAEREADLRSKHFSEVASSSSCGIDFSNFDDSFSLGSEGDIASSQEKLP